MTVVSITAFPLSSKTRLKNMYGGSNEENDNFDDDYTTEYAACKTPMRPKLVYVRKQCGTHAMDHDLPVQRDHADVCIHR